MRRMASKVLLRLGSLAREIEQTCSHSFFLNSGMSSTDINWSALGLTINVKLRSPWSSRSTTTVDVRCSGSFTKRSVFTPSFCKVTSIKVPNGSLPTRPKKALLPKRREIATATLAGAPPGHFNNVLSVSGMRSTTASPVTQT